MGWVRKYHKWLGLIVGFQLVIWLVTGLFMNLVDGKLLSPNTYRGINNSFIEQASTPVSDNLISPQQVFAQHGQGVELRLNYLLNQPVYWLYQKKGLYRHFEHDIKVINANNNQEIVIDQEWAVLLAKASYTGATDVLNIEKVSAPITDFLKEKNDAWQVNFADELNTSVYIVANSGRLIGHSNDNKRLADFMLMLHFMDYFHEGSFNNKFMMIFSLFTLVLVLSGGLWVINMLKHKQYRLR